jgi:hypothetical protein
MSRAAPLTTGQELWANVQIWTEDPKNPRDPATFPFVELYEPQVQVHLSKPNGRKASIVGPYSRRRPGVRVPAMALPAVRNAPETQGCDPRADPGWLGFGARGWIAHEGDR